MSAKLYDFNVVFYRDIIVEAIKRSYHIIIICFLVQVSPILCIYAVPFRKLT